MRKEPLQQPLQSGQPKGHRRAVHGVVTSVHAGTETPLLQLTLMTKWKRMEKVSTKAVTALPQTHYKVVRHKLKP